MAELISVCSSTSRKPIAKISGDNVGISPNALDCTAYVIHHRTRKEGYIGHYAHEAVILADVENIKSELEKELSPSITELSAESSSLDIILAGTNIQSTILTEPTIGASEYERQVRNGIIEIFKKHFPYANFKILFNNEPSISYCLLYIPNIEFIQVLVDTGAWDI